MTTASGSSFWRETWHTTFDYIKWGYGGLYLSILLYSFYDGVVHGHLY
jgi:hypothetical protein